MSAAPHPCRLLCVSLVLVCVASACGGRGAADRTASSVGEHGRTIVLALDGVDPDTVEQLIGEGKLPNFKRLRDNGASGRLRSIRPLLSPVIWTTIATGKRADEHGIGHFVMVDAAGARRPVTSVMRKVRALWNILSDAQRSVAVVGWWATWPPEPVRGVLVSDRVMLHFLFDQPAPAAPANASALADAVSPAAEAPLLEPCLTTPEALTATDLAPFVRPSPTGSMGSARTDAAGATASGVRFDDVTSHLRWALAAAKTHECMATSLWEQRRPDLLMVYVEAVDTTSHLFGHLFRADGLGGALEAERARYGAAVEAMYVRVDGLIGAMLSRIDARSTVVVLSDHGFELGAMPDDPSATRDLRRVSAAHHLDDGVFYAFGHRVRAGARINGATILDVAPTLLALQDLPAAADMPGRVLVDGFILSPAPRIDTYETGAPRPSAAPETHVEAERQAMARLESLGYVSGSSPESDATLAALHFDAGRFAEAVAAYTRLVQADPRNAALRASLAGALGAVGRFDAALAELTRAIELEPLRVEAYQNRAAIHERRGDAAAAIADYQRAARYDPRYEPARRALARLGAPPLDAPRTPREREALTLAEQASDMARRGRYSEAMAAIDRALVIAPRYALLHQYRSNIAHLMGDRGAAIAALEAGLAIDPENALFRENLRRLRR